MSVKVESMKYVFQWLSAHSPKFDGCFQLITNQTNKYYVYILDTVVHVINIPAMRCFTGISRNTQSMSYMLSLTECVENSKIMHCGILINMPYKHSHSKVRQLPELYYNDQRDECND